MFPLAPFLRTLEQDGFRLTIQDYDRIAMVLATDGDWTLQRLRSVLRTLLARNREQQDIFERRFDAFFADLADAPAGKLVVDLDLIKEELEQLSPGKPRRFSRPLSKSVFLQQQATSEKKYPWLRIGFFLSLIFAACLVIFWPNPLQENEVKGLEPTADINNLPSYVIQLRRPIIASRELTPITGNDTWKQSALIVGILFLLCCAYTWYLYKAQKVPKDKPAYWKKDDPTLPRLFPLDRVGEKPAPRLDQETLAHLADCLGYFHGDRPHREPDIPRSLIATIDNGGLPNLIFSRRKELRRLIILINQADPEALLLNPITDELGQGMERLGVQLLIGRYLQDPAVFFPEDGRVRFLADYEAERNGYLLLIFSSTSELSANRQTLEALARWPHIAWMQLRTDSFQPGSMVHRYGIATYPATKAGLLAAFTRFLTETGSVQKIGPVSCQQAELRGNVVISILLETRLADALPWAQACSILQPVPLGLADCLRRAFFAHLPPERIERLMTLPGTSLGKGGFSFSDAVLKELRRGFQIRCSEERRKAILERILAELDKTWQEEYGEQTGAKSGLARLAWQKYYQLVNIQLKPKQALKGIAKLKSSPLGSAIEADLAVIDPDPLRKKLGGDKDALQRLVRLFGKRSGLSLLKRYPLRWFQWVGAVMLVLSLLTASGFGVQEWLAAGKGEARLSVLAEQGGGTGWVGVEKSGTSIKKRASTEGLLRLPLETRLPLRKKWQLVFYNDALQPVYTVELGRISEDQLIRLEYEKVETQGKTGELVVTDDKQGNVLTDAKMTLRNSLFTTTVPANPSLVLSVGEYEGAVDESLFWKPPIPSDSEEISQHFLNSHKLVTLADVGKVLRKALREEGFETSYLTLPEGFALVSNVVEFRFSLDGTPISPNATIDSNLQRLLNSLKEPFNYFKSFFSSSPKQLYQVVSVIVTSGRLFYSEQPKMTFKEAQNLITLGEITIPDALKTQQYNEDEHQCIVLLYVFEKDPSGNKIRFISLTDPNNKIDIRDHLQQTGFWDNP